MSEKARRLLALDQSSQLSGYAVFDENRQLVSYGKIKLEGETIPRIMTLAKKVEILIDEFNIEEVVIEDIYYSGNAETYKILAFAMAVLLFLFEERKLPYATLNATIWKSMCGVKGKNRTAQKQNAQKFIEREYGLKVIQDIADAICIGAGYIKKHYQEKASKSKECKSEEKDLLFF